MFELLSCLFIKIKYFFNKWIMLYCIKQPDNHMYLFCRSQKLWWFASKTIVIISYFQIMFVHMFPWFLCFVSHKQPLTKCKTRGSPAVWYQWLSGMTFQELAKIKFEHKTNNCKNAFIEIVELFSDQLLDTILKSVQIRNPWKGIVTKKLIPIQSRLCSACATSWGIFALLLVFKSLRTLFCPLNVYFSQY